MLCKWCIWYHNTARQAPPIPHSKGTGSAIHLQRKGSCQARILPPVPSAQATDCTLLPSKLLSWLPPHYCYMLLAQDSLLGKAISPQRSISWKTINLSQHSVSELPRQLCWAAMTIKKKKKSLSFCLVSALRSNIPIPGATAAEEMHVLPASQQLWCTHRLLHLYWDKSYGMEDKHCTETRVPARRHSKCFTCVCTSTI